MSRTYQILLLGVVAALAAGGYFKLILAPQRARAADLGRQLVEAEAQLAQTQGTIAAYRGAKERYEANYATVVRLGKAVPADDDTRSLVVQLDAAAKRSGIDFDNVDITSAGSSPASERGASAPPPGAVNVGAYSAMPFNFSFTGRFHGLSSFLTRLERFVTVKGDTISVNGRLLRIDGLALHPAENGWPGLQVDVTASSYIVPGLTGDATSSQAAR